MGVKVEVKMDNTFVYNVSPRHCYISTKQTSLLCTRLPQCFSETLLHLDKANKLALYSTSAILLQKRIVHFNSLFRREFTGLS